MLSYKNIRKLVVMSAVLTALLFVALPAFSFLWEYKLIGVEILMGACFAISFLVIFLVLFLPMMVIASAQNLLSNLNENIGLSTGLRAELSKIKKENKRIEDELKKTKKNLKSVEEELDSEERVFVRVREMMELGEKISTRKSSLYYKGVLSLASQSALKTLDKGEFFRFPYTLNALVKMRDLEEGAFPKRINLGYLDLGKAIDKRELPLDRASFPKEIKSDDPNNKGFINEDAPRCSNHRGLPKGIKSDDPNNKELPQDID